MKKKIILSCIFILIVFFVYRTYRYDLKEYLDSRNIITWSPNVKVNLKDYRGQNTESVPFNMNSYHGIYLKANNLKDARAIAFFNKKKSWIIDTTRVSEADREEMKIRFDLHEYFARKINEKIDLIRNDRTKEFKDLENIYNDQYSKLKSLEHVLFNDRNISKKNVDQARVMVDSLMLTVQ